MERKGSARTPGDPQSCHEVNVGVTLFLYTPKTCLLCISGSPPLLSFVFLILQRHTLFDGRLDFLAHWVCIWLTDFMPRECSP